MPGKQKTHYLRGFEVGTRLGKWTVVSKAEPKITPKGIIEGTSLVRCDCGTLAIRTNGSIRNGGSCGKCGAHRCPHPHQRKYPNAESVKYPRVYNIWQGMIVRCYKIDPNSENRRKRNTFKHYQGKGITVCEEWKNDFMSFLKWALNNGYGENLTIDRIDNSKGYSPDNCRWATRKQQTRNQTNNVNVFYLGVLMCLTDAHRLSGCKKTISTIRYHLRRGKSFEEAIRENA